MHRRVPALRLSSMFRDFRSIFSEELKTRFQLDGTPDEHVLLSLKMSPFIDTSTDGAFGKRATQELMNAIYKTKLRALAICICYHGLQPQLATQLLALLRQR